MRLVGGIEIASGRRHIFRCIDQFMDPRNDVFLLYTQSVENPVSVEKIFNHGPINTIRFSSVVFSLQYVADAG
jgi:hypothetical protein